MKDSTYPDLGLMLLLHVNLYFTVLYFWTAILQFLAAVVTGNRSAVKTTRMLPENVQNMQRGNGGWAKR